MQWRISGSGLQLLQYQFVYQTMLPQFRSAMDDTVPDRCWFGHVGPIEKFSDTDNGLLQTGDRYRFGEQRFALRVSCAEFSAVLADRLGLAVEQYFDERRPDAIQTKFE